MRTEEIDRIRRTAQWMFDAADLGPAHLRRVESLCSLADTADVAGERCHCQDLLMAALRVLFFD